ncbi:MAG: Trk system potassium transporter TrkA [Clostridiales Family XIII bacterium]|jgi:trk system potassium uptake protein TrkA|nr:Trk system potassium transporter TrkA [Clostridiales Family XIII bacterium]
MKIAIVGAGKLGLKIAEMLIGGDHSVTVIDKNAEWIGRLGASLDITSVTGNGKEVSLLKEINVGSYDCLIATTDRDEKNIVIASAAKRLGAGKVIARLRDPEHMGQKSFIMDSFAIDYVTNPDLGVAEEINKYLVEKYTLSNGVFYAGRVSMLEFIANKIPALVGLAVKEADQALKGIRIVALSKSGKVVIPNAEAVFIGADDDLYVVGERDAVDSLSKKVFERGKYTDIRKVMIAGGGKTGLYLAGMLEDFGASVKIIDSDKARCQYLSTRLHNALILHGDATDIDLLKDENFEDMDAFVSVTGFDEENLLLALMAKQAGIEDVIAKISRESFGDLIENMGVDMVLNPVDISANHILRFLQGSKIISSQIIQGQAELIRVVIEDDMALTDKPIARLKLPSGMTIAAIQRGTKVIIPDENTRVEEGDRVIILSLLSDAFDLEKLLRIKQGFFG